MRARRTPAPGPSTRTPRSYGRVAVAGAFGPDRAVDQVPGEDPAELIREVLGIEKEITAGLEKLLKEVEW